MVDGKLTGIAGNESSEETMMSMGKRCCSRKEGSTLIEKRETSALLPKSDLLVMGDWSTGWLGDKPSRRKTRHK